MNNNFNDYKPCNNTCPNCGSSNTEYNPSFALTTSPVQYSIHCKCCDHHFTRSSIILSSNDSIGKLQTWEPNNRTISPDPFMQKGWECPKCGSVMAPFQSYCVFCSNKTSNNTIIYGTGSSPISEIDVKDDMIVDRAVTKVNTKTNKLFKGAGMRANCQTLIEDNDLSTEKLNENIEKVLKGK